MESLTRRAVRKSQLQMNVHDVEMIALVLDGQVVIVNVEMVILVHRFKLL